MRETYANTIPLDLNTKYSYTDYLSWDFKENLELINGQIFRINPKLDSYHQHISSKILSAIAIFFQNLPYKLLSYPEEINLAKEKSALYNDNHISIVRPDISIASNSKNIALKSCNEIPDLIVEIPTTGFSRVEMNEKFTLYEEVGIREYWLVTQAAVFVYILDNEKLIGLKPATTILESHIFPSLKINLEKIIRNN